MRDAVALFGLLDNANILAFLATIRKGEGTSDQDGYRRHFGGRLFDSFADHPRVAITAGLGANKYTSTAAGAYQFLSRTWDGLVAKYGFADFAPRTQDCAALALIDGRGALDDVLSGRFDDAVRKCNREWASLPGSPYGQPTRTLEQARATYIAAGGTISGQADNRPISPQPDAPQAKENTMPLPLIIGALLPSIIEAIPKLGKLFGSGSAVAERNVAAAELAVKIVQEATGARNAQEAAEIVKADPAAAQVAVAAVESRWYELTEAGGGGIDGARKADAAAIASGEPVWKSPSFLIALVLVPPLYLIVASVVGIVGAEWPAEVRSAIAGTVVGTILGSLTGYYFGQSTSRNRTPA